ncbi:MAG: aspartate kinase, monofunctional class [Chloroflexi bacterium]|nr:aspartate kinase, monofunctional class [Chloroflexota bacterium]
MPKPLILKFGGTSVGTPEAMQQAAQVVARARKQHGPVVVVTSALSGVTDRLLTATRAAAQDGHNGQTRAQAAEAIYAAHQAIAAALLPPERRAAALDAVRQRVETFRRLVEAIAVLGEVTPRAYDAVASLGERMSAPLLAAVLEAQGVPAQAVDAAELIVTDATFQNARPDLEASTPKMRAVLEPLLEQGITPVVTGFIGATSDGVTTTLGRGGSDYTAALLGAGLDAAEVWIYTDVDGVMSADPRIVPDARTLPRLSYREVAELAYFGAKVLHPKTIRPVVERGIPLRVRNTFNPDGPDTLIVAEAEASPGTVKAVTLIRGLCLVTVEGRGMLGVPGVAARTFAAVAATETSVVLITQASSEQSIVFAVPEGAADTIVQALESTFAAEIARRDIDRIGLTRGVAVVTVVGAGMQRTRGVAGRVFTALGDAGVNVVGIAQGSSEVAISFVVDAAEAEDAVRAVHGLTRR